jgi:hypothetical protein
MEKEKQFATKPAWVWNPDGTLFRDFKSIKAAATAIGSGHTMFNYACKRGQLLNGYYVTKTDSPPPVNEPEITVVIVKEAVWVVKHQGKCPKHLARESKMSITIIKRMLKGFVFNKQYRCEKRKGADYVMYSRGYEEFGRYDTLAEAARVTEVPYMSAYEASKNGSIVAKRWTFEVTKEKSARGGKSNATLESILP